MVERFLLDGRLDVGAGRPERLDAINELLECGIVTGADGPVTDESRNVKLAYSKPHIQRMAREARATESAALGEM